MVVESGPGGVDPEQPVPQPVQGHGRFQVLGVIRHPVQGVGAQRGCGQALDVGLELVEHLALFPLAEHAVGDEVLGQHRGGRAEHVPEPLVALGDPPEDALLDGVGVHQVGDLHLGPPADAVHPPDALLDPGEVPGQVEVHQPVRGLQVEALGHGVGADHDADGAGLPEPVLDLLLADPAPVSEGVVPVLAPPAVVADHLVAPYLQGVADEPQRVGVLGEDHQLGVPALHRFRDEDLKGGHLGLEVGQLGEPVEAAQDPVELGDLLGHHLPHRGLLGRGRRVGQALGDVGDVGVAGAVLVVLVEHPLDAQADADATTTDASPRAAPPADRRVQRLAPVLQRAAHGVERRGEPAAVDGHDPPHRHRPLLAQHPLVLGVGVAHVVVDGVVDAPGRPVQRQGRIGDGALGDDGGRVEHPGAPVAAQGPPGGAEHPVGHRGGRLQPHVPGGPGASAPLGRLPVVPAGLGEVGDPADLHRPDPAVVQPGLHAGLDGVLPLEPLHHAPQQLPVALAEPLGQRLEIALHVLQAAPLRRQAHQVEQVEQVEGVHLHGGGRGGQQHPPFAVVAHGPQEAQQPVGLGVRVAGRGPAGVVDLVDHHHVPSGALQQGLLLVAAAGQVRRGQQQLRGLPDVAFDGGGRPVEPHQRPVGPVEAGHLQQQLLGQLLLPLDHHRRRHQHQRGLGPARQQQLPQGQADLDGLAQPHLVGQQVRLGVVVDDAAGDGHLVGPGIDPRGGQPHPGSCRRGGPDGRYGLPVGGVERRRGRGLGRVPGRRGPAVGHQLHQPVLYRLGQRDDLPSRPEAALPHLVEAGRERGAVLGPGRVPGAVDAEVLVVVLPAGGGLVHRPVEGHPVAGGVGEHPELGVEVAGRFPGPGRERAAGVVAGHPDPDLQPPGADHPGDHLQPSLGHRVGSQVELLGKLPGQGVLQRDPALQRLDVVGGELGTGDQPHRPAPGHEPGHPGRGGDEGGGGEVPGHPVVADGARQHRHVEPGQRVGAAGGVVAGLQVEVGEHVPVCLADGVTLERVSWVSPSKVGPTL